ATVGRVEVEPGGTNAIPSRVRAWLDARAPEEEVLQRLVAAIGQQAADRAARDGTSFVLEPESVTARVDFTVALRDQLVGLLGGAPVLATGAGHDAGVLASAGVPTAMLFVRNPTGISHSPAEHAEPADCEAGVAALATVLTALSTNSG
nr:M20/M25/M40 family metallo-hydrolase [Nocardioidaceae bacterium]